MQNENGPCPLIAIGTYKSIIDFHAIILLTHSLYLANVLALRNKLSLENKHDRISVEEVVKRIVDFIKKENPVLGKSQFVSVLDV